MHCFDEEVRIRRVHVAGLKKSFRSEAPEEQSKFKSVDMEVVAEHPCAECV